MRRAKHTGRGSTRATNKQRREIVAKPHDEASEGRWDGKIVPSHLTHMYLPSHGAMIESILLAVLKILLGMTV